MNTPFKVVIDCKTPPILARETYLDGILAFCAYQKTKRLDSIFSLPLQQSEGVYHASIWFTEKGSFLPASNPKIYKKAFGSEALKYEQFLDTPLVESSFDQSRGQYKAYQVELFENMQKKIILFGCGDIHQVRELFTELHFLGAKSSLGKGEIASIEVTGEEQDTSLVYRPKEGDSFEAMRPLPIKGFENILGKDYPKGFYRLLPPYYLKEGRMKAFLPQTAIYRK